MNDIFDQGRARTSISFRLDDASLSLLEGRSVHFDPWEADIAWVYPSINWHPLPIFQSFAAYTPYLDEKNADYIESPSSPEIILRDARQTFQGRNPLFDSPATQLAILCNFRAARTTLKWLILERTERRCGEPELLTRTTLEPGQEVPVPNEDRPDRIVTARIDGLSDGLTTSLRALVARGERWFITLGDKRYEIDPLTASEPLILGVPASVDYARPFSIGSPPTSLAVTGGQGGAIQVEFFSIPIE
jgi:hypothetical protein